MGHSSTHSPVEFIWYFKQELVLNNEPKSIKELSNTELAEEIKKKQNNTDFKKQLKEKGLYFTVVKEKLFARLWKSIITI